MVNYLSILKNYRQARQGAGRWPTRTALEAWQEQQVMAHLRRVVPRSKWLQERFAGRALAEWRTLPVVGKTEAMARFEDWNTAGIPWGEAMAVALRAEESRDFSPELKGFTVGLSSGTSGGRGLFLASAAERAAWAGTILGKVLPPPVEGASIPGQWLDGLLPGPHRIALVLRAGGGLYETAGKGRVQFRWFDLMKPAPVHWTALEAFAPTVLVAPPSWLRLLAESGVPINPRRVVSCAETLDPMDRQVLETRFGAPLHEVYQATEGFLAVTDSEGVLRLNEDGLVVEREWQDAAQTRFIPVITDFRRETQPIIRHRLDDVLIIQDKGSRSVFTGLEGIEGRAEDRLWAVGPRGQYPVFGDVVLRTVLRAEDLSDLRIWQMAPGALDVAIQPDGPARRETVARALQGLWAGQGGALTQIQWRPLPVGEAPGVKRRRIRQCWKEGA